jgi:hypothetical protein
VLVAAEGGGLGALNELVGHLGCGQTHALPPDQAMPSPVLVCHG